MRNSAEADLKKKRQAIRDKIRRRKDSIDRAYADIARLELSLRCVERDRREYKS